MTGTEFLTFLLLSFVVGRVTRFVFLDTLWEEWRERIIAPTLHAIQGGEAASS